MAYAAYAIPAAVALFNGMNQSNAASSGAASQLSATQAGIAEQSREFDRAQQNAAPFLQTGTGANQKLAALLGIGPRMSPGTSAFTPLTEAQWNASNSTSNPASATSKSPADIANELYLRKMGYAPHPGYDDVLSGTTPLASSGTYQNYLASHPATAGVPAVDNSAGYGSLLNKFTSADLNADPVYQNGLQFGLDQGTGAINARATQAGGYDSGATLKALTRYASDYGTTKANDSFNRFQTENNNVFNRLSGVSGTGQVANGQVQSAGTTATNNISDLLTQGGNASAAGVVGGANAWGGALQGGVNAYNTGQSNALLQQLLTKNQGYGSNSVDPSMLAG